MKKILTIISGALLALLFLFSMPAHAADNSKNKTVVLPKQETYQGLYNRAGTTINVEGNIDGDAVIVGSNINIDGEINGNLYAVGNNISLKGKINGSAHLAGNMIDVSGEVNKSIYIAGNVVTLSDKSKIGTSLVSFGANTNLNGSVGNQAYLYSGTSNINGSIGSDTVVNSGQVSVGSNAKINGNLKYTSDSQAQISNESNIKGSISRIEEKTAKTEDFRSRLISIVMGLASTFLLGLLLLWSLPKSTVDVADFMSKHMLGSIFCGLLFLILVPIAVILAIVSGIGLHTGLVLGFVYLAVLFAGSVFVALWLGRKITKTKDAKLSQNIWSLAIGLVIIAVINLLPVVGSLLSFVVFLAGIGGLTFRNYNRIKTVSKAQLK